MAREKGLPRCWGERGCPGNVHISMHMRVHMHTHKLCAPNYVRTPPNSNIRLFWGHIFRGAKRNGDPMGQEGEM